MHTKLLFLQLALAAVSGQAVADREIDGGANEGAHLQNTALAPDYYAAAVSVGLAQPTSRFESAVDQDLSAAQVAAETSPEFLAFAPQPTNPTVMNGAEGDLNGAVSRNNLFYFGIGRHGFTAGADCPDCVNGDCTQARHHGQQPCHDRSPPVPKPLPSHHHQHQQPHKAGRSHSIPCEERPHASEQVPYLKVTPSVVVLPETRTHVETKTSTQFNVSTSTRTRTVTEKLYSTSTHIVYPKHTYTVVDQRTVLEYPASTIEAGYARAPIPTGRQPQWEPVDNF